jgi:hypothetical protein
MSTIKISELYSGTLNEGYYSQLTEDLEEVIELLDAQTNSIAGGFWPWCPFVPRLAPYPSSIFPNSEDLVA